MSSCSTAVGRGPCREMRMHSPWIPGVLSISTPAQRQPPVIQPAISPRQRFAFVRNIWINTCTTQLHTCLMCCMGPGPAGKHSCALVSLATLTSRHPPGARSVPKLHLRILKCRFSAEVSHHSTHVDNHRHQSTSSIGIITTIGISGTSCTAPSRGYRRVEAQVSGHPSGRASAGRAGVAHRPHCRRTRATAPPGP